jgi:hypothetical protein
MLSPDADEVKEEPSEFDDDDYECRSIRNEVSSFRNSFFNPNTRTI